MSAKFEWFFEEEDLAKTPIESKAHSAVCFSTLKEKYIVDIHKKHIGSRECGFDLEVYIEAEDGDCGEKLGSINDIRSAKSCKGFKNHAEKILEQFACDEEGKMAITEVKVKKKILCEMEYLEGLRKIIEEGGKNLEVQKKVQKMPYRNTGWLPEVESPELNNTGGDWIRLHLNYCYLFIHPDGSYEYQLDPYSSYGSEVINTGSYESFVEEVKKFENIRQYSFEYIYGLPEE